MNERPELLAPAGDERSLIAAVQAGADAVYLGLREFSARRGAANFSLDELSEATRYAHLRGCKTYLTLNVLVLPHEMERVVEQAEAARELGIDAFIVQDLGLARELGSRFHDVRLHASTQISTNTEDGVKALAGLGFHRVTLARELSVAQVRRLAHGPLPVEVFVHGALCYCYSGQCLLSSMVGGRSGNRGLCVQACRLSYELLDSSGRVDVGGPYPLSTRDLSAIDLIPDLMSAGVTAFKIEGRLKSYVYVATVVDAYRRAIDRFMQEPESYEVPREDVEALEEAFSRGFSEAYLGSVKDMTMMSPGRPSDRGVPVGRITGCDREKGTCRLKATRRLREGDHIEVWVRKGGRVRSRLSGLSVDGRSVEVVEPGQTVTLALEGVGRQDRVFRVENALLVQRASGLLRPSGQVRFVPVALAARLDVGEPLTLAASTEEEVSVTVDGSRVERAREKGVEAEAVGDRLRKLGGSAYRVESLELEVEEDAFLPFSDVNEAKRVLLERLDEERLKPWRREPVKVAYRARKSRPRRPARPALSVVTEDLAVAVDLGDEGIDWLYFDVSFERDRRLLMRRLADVAKAVRAGGGGFALLLPAVAHSSELEQFDALADVLGEELDAFVVASPGQLQRYGKARQALIGDFGLNVTNPEALEVLRSMGLDRTGLSVELSGEQIREVASNLEIPLEVLAFGPVQVMVGEHCLYSLPGSCSRCAGREGVIQDEKGFEFPVRSDYACRTRVYNPFQLSLLRQAPELADAGVNVLRLNLLGYPRVGAREVVRGWKNVLSLLPDESQTALELAEELAKRLSAEQRFTTGHYYRPLT